MDLSGEEIVLSVSEDVTYYDQVSEPASFETVRVANPDLLEGTENVVQEGVDGVRTSIYEVVWSNWSADQPPVCRGTGQHRSGSDY